MGKTLTDLSVLQVDQDQTLYVESTGALILPNGSTGSRPQDISLADVNTSNETPSSVPGNLQYYFNIPDDQVLQSALLQFGALRYNNDTSVQAFEIFCYIEDYTQNQGFAVYQDPINGLYAQAGKWIQISNLAGNPYSGSGPYVLRAGDTMYGDLILSNSTHVRVQLSDGTQVAPSLTFQSDLTSGVYKGTNDINFVVSGNQQLSVNNNGIDVNGQVTLTEQVTDPASIPGSGILYGKAPVNNGSGLFYETTNGSNELITKRQAIIYGLIF